VEGHDLPPNVRRLFDQRLTREQFEALLMEVRNRCPLNIVEARGDDEAQADIRAVWHAAEVALGILTPGYLPKREALADMRLLLAWADRGDDAWLETP
jgi:hypothetical protein